MRFRLLLAGATCVLTSGPGSADEVRSPPIIEVRAPGGDLSISARRGTASLPGLGKVVVPVTASRRTSRE
jgi:hypothetical protein